MAEEFSVVGLNTHVVIELIDPSDESECLEFDIVPDSQADFYSGLLGVSTPLAIAISGRKVGEMVYYEAGEIQRVKVLSIDPSSSLAMDDAAARRKAAVEQAVKQVQRTNALIFATSVEGKWGDYDADGMIENWD